MCMYATLNLPCNGNPKIIYLIYNFKEVSDSVLLVMYVDKFNCWKKIFINYKDGTWNTDTLIAYADAMISKQIRSTIESIVRKSYADKPEVLYLKDVMHEHAALIFGTCS